MSEIPATPVRATGLQILLAAAVAGLAVALFNFVWSGNGIHGSAGAALVVISTALMVAAACALLLAGLLGRKSRGTLNVLFALDILGTGVAAYFLEANWLIAAMAVALAGWIVDLVTGRVPRPSSGDLVQRGAP